VNHNGLYLQQGNNMSRSFRHTAIHGIAGQSDKIGKRILHGKMRARSRQILAKDPEEFAAPQPEVVYNEWSMEKDGKRWFGNDRDAKKYMRK
jgi:hypothetical protein